MAFYAILAARPVSRKPIVSLNPRRLLGFALVVALLAGLGGYFYFVVSEQSRSNPKTTPTNLSSGNADERSREAGKPAEKEHESPGTTPLQRKLTYLNPQYPRAFAVYDQTPPPQGAVAPYIAALWDKADRGDAYAGYLIFRAVYRCVQLQRSRRASDLPGNLAQVETDIADCKDVTQADIDRAYLALHRAAEQGDVEAILLYAIAGPGNLETSDDLLRNPELVARYRADYKRFLEQAVASGNVNAMVTLAGSYSNGILVQADPVLAYAYQYAWLQVRPEKSAVADATLTPYAAQLTPEQIHAAQMKAIDILKRCCQ